MQLQFFVDRVPAALGKLEQTPQGGYVVPAKIARTGVMLYAADAMRKQGLPVPADIPKGGIVRVYMPPEVLQAAADSLKLACVTNEHPARMVTTANFRSLTCGNPLSETVAFDGKYLSATLAIQDQELLRAIELDQKREISAGYKAATDFTPGVTPDGEAYDAVRTGIEYNHIAVVERGRAGKLVSLALDSDEFPTDEVPTVKIKIKGVEHDADKAQAAIDALEGELAAATATATKLQGELTAEKDARAAETSDAALDARLEKRLAAEQAAKERADRRAAVAKAYPSVDLKDATDAFVDGMFATLKAEEAEDADDVALVTGKRGPKVAPQAPEAPRKSAREKMLDGFKASQA